MYKVEINIGDWDWVEGEKVIVETSDFEKAQIIQEFIEFQKEFGWAVDYQLSDEFIDAQCDEEDEEDEVNDEDDSDVDYEDETDEDEEYEEYEIGEIVEDEDGLVWKRVA